MIHTLLESKASALQWVESVVPTLMFITCCPGQGRRSTPIWRTEATGEVVSLPSEPGLYLIYLLGEQAPVYVGQASDLARRLRYHFAESASSDKSSTLKKVLRQNGHSFDGHLGVHLRARVLCLPFGRMEVEEHLHRTYKVNTARARPKHGYNRVPDCPDELQSK